MTQKYNHALIILILAAGLRLLHNLVLSDSSLFMHHTGDALTHLKWSEAILSGRLDTLLPFFRAPLYGFFMSALLMMSGGYEWIISFSQYLLGIGTALLVYELGRKCFSKRVALTSGILTAVYPLFPFFESQLLLTSLFTFLCLLSLTFLERSMFNARYRHAAMAGLIMGLASLTRPNILLFFPVAFLCLFLKGRSKSIVFGLVFVATLLPCFLANTLGGFDPVLISTQGGINLWAGNHAGADGLIPTTPEVPPSITDLDKRIHELRDTPWKVDNLWQFSHILAENDLGTPLSDGDVSQYWIRKTIREIKEDPIRISYLLLRKAIYLVGIAEPPNNNDPILAFREYFPHLWALHSIFNFGFIFSLCLPGIWLAWRNYPHSRILVFYLLILSAVLLIFFVNARFRAPLIPIMILFASVSLEYLMVAIPVSSGIDKKVSALFFTLLISALIMTHLHMIYPISWQWKAQQALYLNSLAKAETRHGNIKRAKQFLYQAIALHTEEQFIFYHSLGRIAAFQDHKPRHAIHHYKMSLSMKPHPVALKDLIRILIREGEQDDARNVMNLLQPLFPTDPELSSLKKHLLNS